VIQGDIKFSFSFGSQCQIESESPLAKIDLITDMTPENGDKGVSVLSVPTGALIFAVDSPQDFDIVNSDGSVGTRTFRIRVRDFTVVDADNNTPAEGYWTMSDDNFNVKFGLRNDPLEGNANILATLTVYAEEWDGHQWNQAKKMDGTSIVETKSAKFKTGPRPDSILKSMVYDSWPLDAQKNYLQNEIRTFRLQGVFGYLFKLPGTYFVRLVPIDGGTPTEIPCSFDWNMGGIALPMPTLTNANRYAFQVIRRTEGGLTAAPSLHLGNVVGLKTNTVGVLQQSAIGSTQAGGSSMVLPGAAGLSIFTRKLPGTEIKPNEKLLYVFYFRTSQFNTLADKIQQFVYSKTDYSKYWGTRERLVAHFASAEDLDDYEMYGYTSKNALGIPFSERPLVVVTAHIPSERWFTQYVWPKIYSHVQALIFARLWSESMEDKFFLLLGMVNFDVTAQFQNASGGKLRVFPFPSFGYQPGKGITSFGGGSGSSDIQVHYLHGEEVPGDYFTLWFKSHMISLGYARGDCDDPNSNLYGLQDWIDQNSSWINHFSSIDLSSVDGSETPMYQDGYTLNFIFGPKFTWVPSGPWIKKTFWYGQTPVQKMLQTGAKSSAAVKLNTTPPASKNATSTKRLNVTH